MNAYLVPVTCPHCSGELDHAAGSTACGTEARAVAKCSRCSREWLVECHLRPVPTWDAILRRRYDRTAT